MIKKKLVFWCISFFLITLIGCSNCKIIKYNFNGVVVTRADYEGKTDFKYGDAICHANENKVVVEYYGFNNGMDILIVFKEDNCVELIPYGGGQLKKIGNPKIKISRYTNDRFELIMDNYRKKGYGIMRLSNSLELEKKFTINLNSKVIPIYP